MTYHYAVRGWLELSWPDLDIEGVDESPEEHAEKVARIRDMLTTNLSPDDLVDPQRPVAERYKAGWGFPQHDLEGTEYAFFAADVEDPAIVLAQVRQVIEVDPFVDGWFSVEGEDGDQYWQWLILRGKVFTRQVLFPDFEDQAPPGFVSLLPV